MITKVNKSFKVFNGIASCKLIKIMEAHSKSGLFACQFAEQKTANSPKNVKKC